MLLQPLFGRTRKSPDEIELLGEACISRDYAAIKKHLTSDTFAVDDSKYVYTLPSRDKNGLLMNASAYLMRCAVASGSPGIVRLLALESAPLAVIDPSAMRNLALQDALLTGDTELIYAITDDARVICSQKYYRLPKLYSLHEFSVEELERYKQNGSEEFDGDSTPLALEVMQSREFEEALFDLVVAPQEGLPVRRSYLHVALLTCFRETEKVEFAQALCLASSLRERELKALWPLAR